MVTESAVIGWRPWKQTLRSCHEIAVLWDLDFGLRPPAFSLQLPAFSSHLSALKEQLNRTEHKDRKGVQCLASMTLFSRRVNIARIAISYFPLCPLRLCGSKCRI
jgi:hypothetical protein